MQHPYLLWPPFEVKRAGPAYKAYYDEYNDLSQSRLPCTRKIRNRLGTLKAVMTAHAKAFRESELTHEQKLERISRCKHKHDVPWSSERVRVRERWLYVLIGACASSGPWIALAEWMHK